MEKLGLWLARVILCNYLYLNRIHYFGEMGIDDQAGSPGGETQNIASLRPTAVGKVAYANWLDIPNHFPFVELDDFVIMPNHIHAIVIFQ